MRKLRAGIVLIVACWAASAAAQVPAYPWYAGASTDTVVSRIPPPEGFVRSPAEPGSFAAWLRGLPVKPGRPRVRLFNGGFKSRQDVHHAVLSVDIGDQDLQQCADAAMRLRAEYLYSRAEYAAIAFNLTNGDRVPYSRWRSGERPRIWMGRRLYWEKGAHPDESYRSFREYLIFIFRYAGSHSLSKELRGVPRTEDAEPGDIFIRGGFPGHAVLVVDTASEAKSGRKVLLLAQSYMPAQDIHILNNLGDAAISPWYLAESGLKLETPEWTFPAGSLKRF